MTSCLLRQKRAGLGAAIIVLAALVLSLSLSLPLLHHLHHGGQLEIEECPVSALSSALALAVLALFGLLLLAAPLRATPLRRPGAGAPCTIHLATQGARAPPFLSIRT